MITTKLWISNRWVEADRTVELRNPHTKELLAHIGYASPEQAAKAIEAAADAFASFRTLQAYERAQILSRAADILLSRREEAAELIVKEAAKPIQAARAELDRTIVTYRFAADAAKQLSSETVQMDAAPRGENRHAYMRRQPIGVVSAITPFNFPFNLVAHKVGPAIAGGNTIVLKPAEKTPLSALFLAEVFKEAGLPAGVLQIIPGDGRELSDVLTRHNQVSYVTFTGSPRVGKVIRANAGLRKVTLELGSNSPLLIDEGFSEKELQWIAEQSAVGAFTYNGQVCISIQRIYVHSSLYESFVRRLTEKANQLRIGDPMDEETDITALIDTNACNRLEQWVSEAKQAGANIRCGGTFMGQIMQPTVLTDVPSSANIHCEEVFGPVVTITSFDSWEEAIRLANDSKYGLNAGAFTKNIEHAFAAVEQLESGAVLINDIPTFRLDHMPYGGVKQSGVGREGIRYAMEEMTELKLVSFRTKLFED
ncbi:aldehyde dehydrogenase family protein [Marinicrinis lubricantis]|uniref:Aldehyde dehydrogenase family protein n=1 Tax=Marinicrinis lubricantis TaxID=2086470 RepID=A0ABW1IN91_9BACL